MHRGLLIEESLAVLAWFYKHSSADLVIKELILHEISNYILCFTPVQDSNVGLLWQSGLWPCYKLLQTGSAENKSNILHRSSVLLSTKRKWSNYFSSWLFSYFTWLLEQSHSHSLLMESDLSLIQINFAPKINFLTFLGPLWTSSKNDLKPTPGLHWNIKFN